MRYAIRLTGDRRRCRPLSLSLLLSLSLSQLASACHRAQRIDTAHSSLRYEVLLALKPIEGSCVRIGVGVQMVAQMSVFVMKHTDTHTHTEL